MLIFVKDSMCESCMAQLIEMAAKLSGAEVCVVSGSSMNDLKKVSEGTFPPRRRSGIQNLQRIRPLPGG